MGVDHYDKQVGFGFGKKQKTPDPLFLCGCKSLFKDFLDLRI